MPSLAPLLLWGLFFLLLFAVPLLLVATLFGFGSVGLFLVGHEKPARHKPSDIYFSKRNYKKWSAHQGWLRASHLFYECAICHKSLPSETSYPQECGCGNLFVGPNHIGAQTPAKVRLFEE